MSITNLVPLWSTLSLLVILLRADALDYPSPDKMMGDRSCWHSSSLGQLVTNGGK